MEERLLTAKGKIQCLRCTAHSKRSGLQCGRPALKGSRTQKCQFHGGKGNSAPKSAEGRKRVALAHTKSGQYSAVAKRERSLHSAKLSQLEDIVYLLGMSTATRTPGRKSAAYTPIRSLKGARVLLIDSK
jgi:hypothetical protein